jgi:serine/threonine protein phosphatase 1
MVSGMFRALRQRIFGAPRARIAGLVPPSVLVYAIGDIHGEVKALQRLLTQIEFDARQYEGADKILVFLGDYVDRGADSRAVLDCLSAGPLPDFSCHALLGNHEQAMLDFLDDPVKGSPWLAFGGAETLASYGVRASFGVSDGARCRGLRDEALHAIPERHLTFLRALKPQHVIGDYVFVHAGIRPGRSLARQSIADLLTIRAPFLTSRRMHEKIVVHGHTIIPEPECRHNRIAIDTGAYASGVLTSLVLWQGEQRFLQTR